MLAPRLLQRTLSPYPKDNIRYVPTIQESIERLQAATYDQVVQIYREYLGSQEGELTIVGNFDPDACLPVLKSALAGWKAARPYARIANPIASQVAGSMQRIATPDKANATYVAGLLFPLRDDAPDYPAVLMGNYIFGGGSLSSRLATRVRQQEGLSYSVGSTLSVSSQDQRASLNISAIVNPQNIAKLEKSVLDELDRLLRNGVTADELDKAREGYLQSRKVSRSSDPALAGTLSGLRHLDRTMAWEADFEKKIAALTPDQVNAALRKHIDPKKLVVVAAGDFEATPAGRGVE
jgi:zinc protease